MPWNIWMEVKSMAKKLQQHPSCCPNLVCRCRAAVHHHKWGDQCSVGAGLPQGSVGALHLHPADDPLLLGEDRALVRGRLLGEDVTAGQAQAALVEQFSLLLRVESLWKSWSQFHFFYTSFDVHLFWCMSLSPCSVLMGIENLFFVLKIDWFSSPVAMENIEVICLWSWS